MYDKTNQEVIDQILGNLKFLHLVSETWATNGVKAKVSMQRSQNMCVYERERDREKDRREFLTPSELLVKLPNWSSSTALFFIYFLKWSVVEFVILC